MVALWPPPLEATMFAGGAFTLVSAKLTLFALPEPQMTLYGPPRFPLAIGGGNVAIPEASVATTLTPPAKVTLGPLCAGAANDTCTFGVAFPNASVTVATSGFGKAVLTAADCPLPLVTVICAAAPALLIIRIFALVAAPDDAITEYDPLTVFAVTIGERAMP